MRLVFGGCIAAFFRFYPMCPSRKMKKNIESLQKDSKGHRMIFPCGLDLNNQIRCLLQHLLRKKRNIGTIKTNRSAQLNFRLYAPVFAVQIGVHKNF